MDAFSSFNDVDVEAGIFEVPKGLFSCLLPGLIDFPAGSLVDFMDLAEPFLRRYFPILEDSRKALAVAGFAGRFSGSERFTLEKLPSFFFMENVAAFAAQSFFQHDVGDRVGNTLPSRALVENLLSLMKAGMTGLAIGDGFDILDDFVLNLEMALVAFDFVGCDMSGMHQVCFFVFVQAVRLPVAFITILPGNSSVPHDDLAMAFIAFKSVIKNGGMVEAGCLL